MNNKLLKKDVITVRLFQNTMLTMLIAELSGAVTAIIDGIITGQFIGPTGLAACGIGAPYFSVSSIISGILMVGCTAMCTKAVGKGDKTEVSRVFSLTIILGVVLSTVLALLGVIFPGTFATIFGAKESNEVLYTVTSDYLRGVFIGAPAFIMFAILIPILQLDGDAKRPKIASITMAIIDVVGDLLNVTIFKGGMFGMGLASSISQYAALFVLLTHFLKKSELISFSIKNVNIKMTPKLVLDGLPRAICMLCRGLLPILINNLVLNLAGNIGVTAYSSMNSTSFLVGALGWGIGGAVLIMGGMSIGEQDVKTLSTVIKTALKDIIIGVTCFSAIVFILSPLIARLFITELGETYEMTTVAIRCYAIALPFLAFNNSASNYLQVLSKKISTYVVNICIEFAGTAIIALILVNFIGIMGVWLAFPIGQAMLTLVIVLFVIFKRDKNREKFESFLLLKPDVGVSPNDYIDRSIYSMNDVVSLSVDVSSFCIEHNLDKKKAYKVALCIEEMAGNVVEHGFSDGKKHHLDIRVIVKDGNIILRLRDDCEFFDLSEKVKKWTFDPENPEKNIGIRMVMASSKDIIYTRTMKTNNLIVTI